MNKKNEEILKIYIKKINYFKYSKNTVKIYSHYFKEFIEKIDKYKEHYTSENFESYLLNYKFSSTSQQNQLISALKFGYEKVFNKKYNKVCFDRPRKEEKLPNIISEEYLKQCLGKINNLKHKTILSLTYSIGLRRGDIQNLKTTDINFDNKQIKVVNGKGKKDSYLPLTTTIINLLLEYKSIYNPSDLLFGGQKNNVYSGTSLNNLVKKYIGYEYHFHNLRHSCFTHLLNKGTDISYIQKLARHKDIKTTMVYLRISTEDLQQLPIY